MFEKEVFTQVGGWDTAMRRGRGIGNSVGWEDTEKVGEVRRWAAYLVLGQ